MTCERRVSAPRRLLALGAMLVALCAVSDAEASEIFFNGVRVTGLRNQSFKGCAVRFDAKGNVYITAKGYTVKTMAQTAYGTQTRPGKATSGSKGTAPTLAPRLHYFLVAAGARPKAVQYAVDVFINGKWIRKIRSSDGQDVVEVTKYLKRGRNLVNFTATKDYAGKPRASTSPNDYLRVLIGAGSRGGGTVNITKTLADFRVAASKVANFGHPATLEIE
ncbi:MAG: hypothetical protein KAI47_13285 [Deltaproteobacteria bacterium]|nr:hypothetical protein [Deltaproteobacteria bacterium]